MEFEKVLDIILNYHYTLVRELLKDSRQRDFINLNDKASAAREIMKAIINKLPEESRKKYTKAQQEKMESFARSVYFVKELCEEGK